MKSAGIIDHDSTWAVEEINPTFFVVTDQYFKEEALIHVEVEAKFITSKLLTALRESLVTHPGWEVRLAVYRVGQGLGHLLISADKVVSDGPLFASCSNTIEIIRACQEQRNSDESPRNDSPCHLAAAAGTVRIAAGKTPVPQPVA